VEDAVGVWVTDGVGVSVGVLLGVQVGQWVSVGIRVRVGKRVDVIVGVMVGCWVDVAVGVWLGVHVAQWVSVGCKTWLETIVGVNVCEIVAIKVGISVGAGMPVPTGVFVCAAVGTLVAVRSREATGVVGAAGWAYFPLRTNALPAMINTIKIKASQRNSRPAAIFLRRSGQLAIRRLVCMDWEAARILKKTPSKPRKMAMRRPVRMSMRFIIAYGTIATTARKTPGNQVPKSMDRFSNFKNRTATPQKNAGRVKRRTPSNCKKAWRASFLGGKNNYLMNLKSVLFHRAQEMDRSKGKALPARIGELGIVFHP
jgi:hypothetical protein